MRDAAEGSARAQRDRDREAETESGEEQRAAVRSEQTSAAAEVWAAHRTTSGVASASAGESAGVSGSEVVRCSAARRRAASGYQIEAEAQGGWSATHRWRSARAAALPCSASGPRRALSVPLRSAGAPGSRHGGAASRPERRSSSTSPSHKSSQEPSERSTESLAAAPPLWRQQRSELRPLVRR